MSFVQQGNWATITSHSYSRYRTGTSLQWRLMRENIIQTPRISLSFKLAPVLYREYENGKFPQVALKMYYFKNFRTAKLAP